MAAAESDQDPLRRLSSRGVSSRSACRVAALLAAALLASSFAYALLMPVRYMPLGGPHRMLATVSVTDAMDVLYLAYAAFCPQDDLRAWRCEWCSGPNKHRYWLGRGSVRGAAEISHNMFNACQQAAAVGVLARHGRGDSGLRCDRPRRLAHRGGVSRHNDNAQLVLGFRMNRRLQTHAHTVSCQE